MRSANPRSFNEAGAKSAGKPYNIVHTVSLMFSFNEAGAKSAGKPVVLLKRAEQLIQASMRPAQKSAGKRPIRRRRYHESRGGFNEAGAKSAGKLAQRQGRVWTEARLQ